MSANNKNLATQIATLKLEIAALKREIEALKAKPASEVHHHYHYSYPQYQYWYPYYQPNLLGTSGTISTSNQFGNIATSYVQADQNFQSSDNLLRGCTLTNN